MQTIVYFDSGNKDGGFWVFFTAETESLYKYNLFLQTVTTAVMFTGIQSDTPTAAAEAGLDSDTACYVLDYVIK